MADYQLSLDCKLCTWTLALHVFACINMKHEIRMSKFETIEAKQEETRKMEANRGGRCFFFSSNFFQFLTFEIVSNFLFRISKLGCGRQVTNEDHNLLRDPAAILSASIFSFLGLTLAFPSSGLQLTRWMFRSIFKNLRIYACHLFQNDLLYIVR